MHWFDPTWPFSHQAYCLRPACIKIVVLHQSSLSYFNLCSYPQKTLAPPHITSSIHWSLLIDHIPDFKISELEFHLDWTLSPLPISDKYLPYYYWSSCYYLEGLPCSIHLFQFWNIAFSSNSFLSAYPAYLFNKKITSPFLFLYPTSPLWSLKSTC